MTHRTLEELAELPHGEVAAIFDGGSLPSFDSLVDWEFRGQNLPFITRLLGFQKFKKGFFRAGGRDWGYNIPVRQGAGPWRCVPSDERPKRFGFYSVSVVRPGQGKEPGSLLLNYADGKNRLWEGSFLRDYLRQVEKDEPDLLLGKAYTALAGAQLVPSYFILQRDRRAPGEPPKAP